jgi:hypothetical protein
MIKPITVIHADLDPKSTLKETWEAFAIQLVRTGADKHQLDAMEMAFYMGAAQTYSRIDAAARFSTAALAIIMRNLNDEIDKRIGEQHPLNITEGNA